ncbi:hypothetical protein AB0I81_22740 [Nonomuraea sp. NPDC050404]|uniref:hypothetical protein n=1 Tax=Nonomuraea sp. NPDC050404 TaxID=3155783 RepID=UPI0033C4ECD6
MTSDDTLDQRGKVVARYARRDWRGRIARCLPSKAELSGAKRRRESTGSDRKVIYADLATAETAARELEKLGAPPLRAYLCNRSKRGHAHLTSMPWGGR